MVGLARSFQHFNLWQDGNGFINRVELRHVMMNLGEKMSELECDALVDVKSFRNG